MTIPSDAFITNQSITQILAGWFLVRGMSFELALLYGGDIYEMQFQIMEDT
jgi:hypothetical protein